ncbi:MAG: T9SS type A sorting domain-containing protein [Melioribacteraceae bacterium]|nr:T9SS type A sorting domain-containing protein [Melioribacteraceae bacterium]
MPIKIIVLFLSLSARIVAQDIIINEFSQGAESSKEWIELVVTSDNQDIRGVYFADDSSFSSIEFQLKTDFADFSIVGKGSVIVIYNAAYRDDILPADDFDFSDGIIIIPDTNTTFLESGSNLSGLSNTGENFGLMKIDGTGIHGITYGDGNPSTYFDSMFGEADILTPVGAGKSAHFTEDTPEEAGSGSNWSVVSYDLATPGRLNGSNNDALPVELIFFDAVQSDKCIQLRWGTATEINNYGFDIERASASFNSNIYGEWECIGFVPGSGNSSSHKYYEYYDNNPVEGNLSYRLKQIDTDGSYEYYNNVLKINFNLVASVNSEINEEEDFLGCYPNPVNSSMVICFQIRAASSINLDIYDLQGRAVLNILKNTFLECGRYNINVDCSILSSGVYLMRFFSELSSSVKKLIVLK